MFAKHRGPDTEEEIREAFRVFDREGRGFIPTNELHHVLTNLGENLTDDEVEEMILQADANHDGVIEYKGKFVFLSKLIDWCCLTRPLHRD